MPIICYQRDTYLKVIPFVPTLEWTTIFKLTIMLISGKNLFCKRWIRHVFVGKTYVFITHAAAQTAIYCAHDYITHMDSGLFTVGILGVLDLPDPH